VPRRTPALEQTTATESVHRAHCRLPLGEAQARAEGALAHARAHREWGHRAYALCLIGEGAARRELPALEPAEAHYRQARALAEGLGMRPLQAHCHRGLGTLYAKMRQREQARAELSTAIVLYRRMAMTFWLPLAEARLEEAE
jgi:tetratricopeptide (TPR) repeat protein